VSEDQSVERQIDEASPVEVNKLPNDREKKSDDSARRNSTIADETAGRGGLRGQTVEENAK
jgi:hypothetical protein